MPHAEGASTKATRAHSVAGSSDAATEWATAAVLVGPAGNRYAVTVTKRMDHNRDAHEIVRRDVSRSYHR